MTQAFAILAYLGPETTLPVTSALASVVGLALMFGRNTFRIARLIVARALARGRGEATAAR